MEIKIKKILISMIVFMMMLLPVASYAEETEDADEAYSEEELVEVISKAAVETKEPTINSRAAVVIDRKTGSILYEKNANQVRKMASTTKIMTAIVVIEKANLKDVVTISKKAGGTGGSRMGLKENDKVTVKDLLYGLMLPSGNDAAVALAEYVGGSIEEFAMQMNQKAKELGLTHSHFVTPHGLDQNEHYTNAYELAFITNYALNIPLFAEIVKTKSQIIHINENTKELRNTNELLGYLNGVYGVKTGFTNGANRCLVTAVKRGNLELICVVLGADTKKNRTRDSIHLIEHVYKNYRMESIEDKIKEQFHEWKKINEKRIIIHKGIQENPDCILGNILYKEYPFKKEDMNKLEFDFYNIEWMEAPVEGNKKVGEMTVKLDNKILFSIPIWNKKTVEKKKIKDYFVNIFVEMPYYLLQEVTF